MFSTSTVDSSTRMPIGSARPPSVIRLSVWPVSHRATMAPRSANGILRTTTSTLRQSWRNKKDHQPGEDRAQQAFGGNAPHGARDVGRLVKLETDVDVVRQNGPHFGEVGPHFTDDAQRGGVGPFGHQDVDGATAVDQGVAGWDVGAVFDGGDVAKIDVLAGSERDAAELFGVLHHGVDGHDGHLIADARVARRTDRVARVQGLDHVIGGSVVGASGRDRPERRWSADCLRTAAAPTRPASWRTSAAP